MLCHIYHLICYSSQSFLLVYIHDNCWIFLIYPNVLYNKGKYSVRRLWREFNGLIISIIFFFVSTSCEILWPREYFLIAAIQQWSQQFFFSPARLVVIHAPPASSILSRLSYLSLSSSEFPSDASPQFPPSRGGQAHSCHHFSSCGGQQAARGTDGIRGLLSRNAKGERVRWMNGVRYVKYVCRIFRRVAAS